MQILCAIAESHARILRMRKGKRQNLTMSNNNLFFFHKTAKKLPIKHVQQHSMHKVKEPYALQESAYLLMPYLIRNFASQLQLQAFDIQSYFV